ncbi:hypothetical protein Droror1_Dr00025632 [Drosera rotundifolia]
MSTTTLKLPKPPPLFISTHPSHATQNLPLLSQLYTTCNHSCHRFPNVNLDPNGQALTEPVDIGKLGVAVENSDVVVTVWEERQGLEWWEKWGKKMGERGGERLVGFGRAVSDLGLTASIYDVMVIPSLRRMGIGRKIVQKITRLLTNRGIYDISAVCSDDERLFFEACGFGDDLLGSTTMMYARTDLSHVESCEIVQAG